MNAPLLTADRRAAAEHPGAQAIADLVATGQLPQAIATATQALAHPALDADARVALLALRFECHVLRMEMAQAGADVQALQVLFINLANRFDIEWRTGALRAAHDTVDDYVTKLIRVEALVEALTQVSARGER